MPHADGLTINFGPGKTIRRLYFGVFLILVGLAVISWLTLLPLFHVFAARSWVPIPCTIVSSKLEGNSDGSGTHLIAIVYEYTFQSQTHQGNRYAFVPAVPTAGYNGKQVVVAANPPGHRTTCFVNPAAPEQSVLERGATVDFLWGLASLPFVIVGAYLIVLDVRKSSAVGMPSRSRD